MSDLIVLDEPTSGMDGEGILGITTWVNVLAQDGKVVAVITHDELLNELACDRMIQLEEGGMIYEGNKQSINIKDNRMYETNNN